MLLSAFAVVAFAAIAYAIAHEIENGEKDREEKWADYEHRKKH